MKNWKLYVLNIFLLILVGYSILPDFSLNKNNFEKVSGILSYVRLENVKESRPKRKLFNNLASQRIIITIADSHYHEYYISDIYKEHWDVLLNRNAIGKEVVLYLGKENKNEDPFRVELDHNVVYDTDVRYYRNILIILFTLALSIRNLYFYFKEETKTPFETSIKKADSSALQSVRNKIKHYFLE